MFVSIWIISKVQIWVILKRVHYVDLGRLSSELNTDTKYLSMYAV